MKKVIGIVFLSSALFVFPRPAVSQQQAAYQVPDFYRFDYEVVQQVNNASKNSDGTKTITYFYSQNGDYTAIKVDNKNNNLMINTKDGMTVIVDDQKKTITIFRLQNILGDLSKIADGNNKKSTSTTPPQHDTSNFKVAKTGNTKQISGYTAEEYSFTNSKGEKGTVWYAKVDFNTGLFFLFGAGLAPSAPAMNKHTEGSPAYPQLSDPHLLFIETENNARPGEGIITQSISKKSLVISSKGYTINNLSKMMGQ